MAKLQELKNISLSNFLPVAIQGKIIKLLKRNISIIFALCVAIIVGNSSTWAEITTALPHS